jgi:Cys-tRNA(Pro) deacylase
LSKLEEVKQFIKKRGLDVEIIEHDESGLTSKQAAEATGVDIEQIIKTLLFMDKKHRPVIVICQGHKRVDMDKVMKFVELKKPRLARTEEIKELLGTEPGGTPPICLPGDIPVLVDKGVTKQEFVVGSAGTKFTGLKLKPYDIVKFSGGKIVDITEG